MNRYTLEVSWAEDQDPDTFTLDAYDLDHLDQIIADTFEPGVDVVLESCAPVALGAGYSMFPRHETAA